MKKIYTTITALIIAVAAFAQNPLPNASFENWTGGKPTGWGLSDTVSKTSDAHTGNWAVQGIYQSFLTLGLGTGTPTNVRWDWIELYYKFFDQTAGNAKIRVVVEVMQNSIQLGGCAIQIPITSSTWRYTALPITYDYSGTPTHVYINIFFDDPYIDTYFIIDDIALTLDNAIGMVDAESNSIKVIPNPARNIVQIQSEILRSNACKVNITDLTGRMVKEFTAVENNTPLNVNDIASGNYIVSIISNETVQTKRLVIE